MSGDLETRIAAALTEQTASSDLAALLHETEAAIAKAEATAETEREKGLDPIASPDATVALATVVAAEFARDRLRRVLPRLEARLEQVETQEYRARWRARYEEVEERRDALAAELRELYPKLASTIAELFVRVDVADREISEVNQASPPGLGLHLREVELEARDIDRFTTAAPSIANGLRLPVFDVGQELLWPQRRAFDPDWLAPAPYDRRYSADWWRVKQEAASAKEEQDKHEAAEREAKALENYHGPRWWERTPAD
jgi:hypothetical protein